MGSCADKEISRLQMQNDSIRDVLNVHHRFQTNLIEVRGLLDSIDRNRHLLVNQSENSITLQEFSSRLADINRHIAMSQEKIQMMESGLTSSRNNASDYFELVLSLKDEMQRRQDQISNLHQHIGSYKSANDSVQEEIKVTEMATKNARENLAAKQKQLLLLQSKMEAMSKRSRAAEADAYYARARQVEETAKRTKLAPKKKRAAYEEALELYKIALSFGKDEARVDISNLDKRLHR